MKAEGLVAQQPNAVVQPFKSTIGEAVLDGGEDALAMLADRSGELDEGWQFRARGPGEPGVQSPRCDIDGFVVHATKRLLEQVRAVQGTIDDTEDGELLVLPRQEVLRRLEQEPAGLLQRRRVGVALERTDSTASNNGWRRLDRGVSGVARGW